MPPLNMHAPSRTARAALASGLAAALACAWIDPAQAQRKAVKWVVTCPAPRVADRTEPAGSVATATPDADASVASAAPVSPVRPDAPVGADLHANEPPEPPAALPATGPASNVEQPAIKVADPSAGRVVYVRPKPEPWIAVTGGTLRSELMRWAEKAGWKVIYDTKTDYRIYGDIPFTGSFDQAADSFVRLYERAAKPLVADISLAQRLIYITNRK